MNANKEIFFRFANVNQKISTNQHMFTYNIFNKLVTIYYSYNFLKNPNYINEAFFENIKAFYLVLLKKIIWCIFIIIMNGMKKKLKMF